MNWKFNHESGSVIEAVGFKDREEYAARLAKTFLKGQARIGYIDPNKLAEVGEYTEEDRVLASTFIVQSVVGAIAGKRIVPSHETTTALELAIVAKHIREDIEKDYKNSEMIEILARRILTIDIDMMAAVTWVAAKEDKMKSLDSVADIIETLEKAKRSDIGTTVMDMTGNEISKEEAEKMIDEIIETLKEVKDA